MHLAWGVRPPVHVLLVEDDPLTAFMTTRFLQRSTEVGAITVASDGREALDQLHGDASVDVVFTDLSMPRMSGLELASAMRGDAELRDLPVVIVTGSTDAADRDAATAIPVAGYVVKSREPPYFGELLAWLHAYRS